MATISATSNIELPELVINGSISNPVSVVVPTDPQLDITETIQDWAYDISKKAKTTGEALNEDAINVSIENILSTLRGERLFAPLFGSNLTTQVFDSLNVTKAQNLLDELMFAIELWEDRVTIIKEQIEMNILTEENAFTLVLPYIINRNGLTGSFARKVIL